MHTAFKSCIEVSFASASCKNLCLDNIFSNLCRQQQTILQQYADDNDWMSHLLQPSVLTALMKCQIWSNCRKEGNLIKNYNYTSNNMQSPSYGSA